jgi:hypothetical protein
LRVRTHEWAEHQFVSFFDIDGIGRGTIQALWKLEITTAQKLMEADPEQLAAELHRYDIPPCKPDQAAEVIRGWQEQARRLWAQREETEDPEENC